MKNLFLSLCLWLGLMRMLSAQNTLLSPAGITVPNLSNTAILALPTPSKGTIVFDNTTNVLRFYNGNKWVALANTTAQTGSSPATGTANLSISPKNLTLPRLTYTAIMALTSPKKGTMVFDVTNSMVRVYNGTGWAGISKEDQLPRSAWIPKVTTYTWVEDIATDADSNLYVAGAFSEDAGPQGLFLKYNSDGILQRIQTVQAYSIEDGFAVARDIAPDAVGNIYLAGSFYGTVNFGNTPLTSSGSYDFFLAKYTADGNLLWVQKAGGAADEDFNHIAVDASGNVYMTGPFANTVTFGTTNVTSTGETDFFLAKYTTNGALQWVQKAGGTGIDEGSSIATDGTGNVYTAGYLSSNAVFGTTHVAAGGFIVKYTGSGTVQWAYSNNDLTVKGVITDGNGNVYATGSFVGTTQLGSFTLTSASNDSDVFLAKYNGSGTIQWAQRAGGTGFDRPMSLAIDNSATLYVTGIFQGTATFSPATLTSAGNDDMFLAKYNSNGTIQWAKKAGDLDNDSGRVVTVGSGNNVYVAGSFRGTATFGTTILTFGEEGYSPYLMKVTP